MVINVDLKGYRYESVKMRTAHLGYLREALIPRVASQDLHVIIVGNAGAGNATLAMNRAKAVSTFLVERGIDPNALGYYPVANGQTPGKLVVLTILDPREVRGDD